MSNGKFDESLLAVKKDAIEYIVKGNNNIENKYNDVYLYFDKINNFMKINKITNKEKFIDIYFDLVKKKFVNAQNNYDYNSNSIDEIDEVIDTYSNEGITIDKMKLIHLVALILMFYT